MEALNRTQEWVQEENGSSSKKKKKKSWDHLDGASIEARKDTDVANDAGKCRGAARKRGDLDV